MTRNAKWTVGAFAGRLRGAIERRVQIDTRTLALFRIFVGLLIVADVLLRSRSFSTFYTDDALIPQSLAVARSSSGAFSIFHYTSSPTVIAALFVVHALVAVLLIVGYKTRLAAILSFVFVVSLDHHNPLVLSYADTLFRLLLFWAIFLPLGERWSIDAVHREREPRATVASVASALILTQMVIMYFVNAIHKNESELWHSGEAAPLVLGLDHMTFLLGETVRTFPTLLQFGGLLWFYMLAFSWLLLVLTGRKRLLFALLFVGGHVSFAVTVRIGAFPYVALAGLLLFVQTQIWTDAKTVARYVGIGPDRFTARFDRLEQFAASVPNVGFDTPRHRELRGAVFSAAVGVLAVAIVVSVAFTALPLGNVTASDTTADTHINDVASTMNVNQPEWSIFAPNPHSTDRYYVFPALTEDGDRVDVYSDRPLAYDRPFDELQKQYGTYRERFYMNSIRSDGLSGGETPEILADHLCETWTTPTGAELTHINMHVVYEEYTIEEIDSPEDRDVRASELYQHGCGDHEPIEIDPPEF